MTLNVYALCDSLNMYFIIVSLLFQSEDGLTGKLTFSADQDPTLVTLWTATTTALTGIR